MTYPGSHTEQEVELGCRPKVTGGVGSGVHLPWVCGPGSSVTTCDGLRFCDYAGQALLTQQTCFWVKLW